MTTGYAGGGPGTDYGGGDGYGGSGGGGDSGGGGGGDGGGGGEVLICMLKRVTGNSFYYRATA
jgi:hypothetical protein